jgi:hypothetical protein
MSFEEGMKTEDSKKNGKHGSLGSTQASAKRFDPEFELAECAAAHQRRRSPNDVGACCGGRGHGTPRTQTRRRPNQKLRLPLRLPPILGALARQNLMELPEFKKW